jgi:YVTN family beta-propeller protein
MIALLHIKIILLFLFSNLFGSLPIESTPSQSLLILSKTERTLAIVDPVSLKVIARMPVGPDPHEVIASADGKFAYVTNYGGGLYNTLAVLDLVEQKALPSVDLGALRGPHGIMFAGGKVWFTAEAANVIGRYDPATKKVDFVFGTGQRRTHMLYLTESIVPIFTTNMGSNNVSMIEKSALRPGREDWDQTLIPVGKGPEGFDVKPDGKEVWVANSQDGTISIIDVASKKVTKTLDANVKGANRLKFTPNGKHALVSLLNGSDAVVIDVASHAEIKRIKLGRGAAGIQMQPDGARAFIACTPDDYVAIIDLKSLEIVGRIDVGKMPDGMAWAIRR